MKRIGLLCAVLCAVILALPAVPLLAQDFRGAISGTVADASGAVLPGVTVTVTNVETNVSQNVVTDEKGFYQFR
ncbi:MAG TPA: carboxypeptidase regulatory-like domain-containing protein, partial [Thermoanaerobaculia bacterium]